MRIRELRIEKGITHRQLAESIHTGVTNIARWERELVEPSSSYIIALSNYFECSTDYLLGRSDDFGNVNTNADLSSEESEIIETFRSLTSDRDKTLFLLFVRNMQPASFAKKYKKPDETHRA